MTFGGLRKLQPAYLVEAVAQVRRHVGDDARALLHEVLLADGARGADLRKQRRLRVGHHAVDLDGEALQRSLDGLLELPEAAAVERRGGDHADRREALVDLRPIGRFPPKIFLTLILTRLEQKS